MTGTRGPISKPKGRAQGHRAREEAPAVQIVPAVVELEVPKPPTGLLKSTREDWAAFWRSDLAAGIDRDPPASPVVRLFQMRDELARARRVVRRQIMTTGSMGQIRVNPLASHCLALEAAILKLEDQYGLTPAARARLVGDTTLAARDAAEIQALFALPEVPDDVAVIDPRLRALEAGDED